MKTKAVALALLLVSAPARADVVYGLSVARAKDSVSGEWVEAQIAEANRLFGPLGTRFRWTKDRELADAHREMHTRKDRDALAKLSEGPVIDLFLVHALEDVDEPGRMRRGVCWTGPGGRRYLVMSKIAGESVLAHELGHFFGNPHSTVVNNVMSYAHDGAALPFFDDAQAAIIRAFSTRFLAQKRLLDVGAAP